MHVKTKKNTNNNKIKHPHKQTIQPTEQTKIVFNEQKQTKLFTLFGLRGLRMKMDWMGNGWVRCG